MQLVVDARYTRTDHHDGISRFTASLIEALARNHDVRMLISDEAQLPMLPAVPYVVINSPTSPVEPLTSLRVNRLRPDVVFSPMQTMGSLGRRFPLVLTLHDLIYYQHPTPPGFLPAPVRLLWRLFHKAYWPQRFLLNRADVVATVSHTTASLMLKHELTRRPIRIVSNASAPMGQPRDPNEGAANELVYMGSFMEYKNVETLIRGMAHLPGYTLRLLSKIRPDRRRDLEALIPAGASVVFHDGVSEEEYAELLRRARASVTLSKAEGFGIPLVEAMGLGTPVVCADTPIFREIGADAALFVDADDDAGFASAVRSLENTHEFAARSGLSRERAAHYSWERSAEDLWRACQEARTLYHAKER
ncbi:glycosyltransferase family 4 protein [Pseudoglutamicibacter albus]|uniref:Mannosyltransferase n=1 Tax=Pseudoglutamicibacter albus DNF00011 TaxID=1401063 RepID=A0A095YBT1_9MICC|nr:glycosyltransferase family 1 protein [Pseudoglutamicibacter albus]KGF19905.1 mannosyltransferase [Pseudoglutamicibacter albus DNF00011]